MEEIPRSTRPTFLSRLKEFLKPSSEHWHVRLTADMGWFRRHGLLFARVVRLVGRGFRADHCSLHASALTFFSLLSIVPLLALGLALAKVFGGGDVVRNRITCEIARFGQRLSAGVSGTDGELTRQFVGQLTSYSDEIFAQIDTISFGTLGGIGLLLLLWMGIMMLSLVETSFNSVWDARPRKLWRKCSDYLTLIIVFPFLALAASTLSIVPRVIGFLTGHIPFLAQIARYGVTPILALLAFLVMFMFVPNAKVRFRAGLAGALFAVLGLYLWLKACTALQVGVVRYSQLYGGFAALPILLMWVYYSWQIVLIGAELSFAVQYSGTFFQDEGARTASFRARVQVALVLVAEMSRRMLRKEKPLSIADYTAERGVSLRLAKNVLEGLTDSGIVARADKDKQVFLLVRSPEKLTVRDVAEAVADRGTSPEALGLGGMDCQALSRLREAKRLLDEQLDIPVSDLFPDEKPCKISKTS